jgi:predicted nuclease with TOPRIM domain
MLEEAHSLMDKKREEFKELCKKYRLLEQSFDKLKGSHERLKVAHEKLENAHSSLLAQEKKEPLPTSNIGITCDILDESFL